MVNFWSEMHLKTVSLKDAATNIHSAVFQTEIHNLEVKVVVTESTEDAPCSFYLRTRR